MAGPYDPAVKAVAWQTAVALQDLANPGSLKANPTLATGDVKVDKDGAGFINVTTLPTVTPAAGRRVAVSLSGTEMNADLVTLQFVDQTVPKEWADVVLVIQTRTATPAVAGDAMDLIDGAIIEATITAPVEAAGRPTGILGMIRRLFEWTSNKRTRDRSSGTVLLRDATDATTLETQTQSTTGTIDTQTKGT